MQREAENADLRHEVRDLTAQVVALMQQNKALMAEVGTLRARVNRLRTVRGEHATAEEHMPGLGAPKQMREKTPRKTREGRHNKGRHRAGQVDAVVEQTGDACPRCGTRLSGGWVHRRMQVFDLPEQQKAVVTEQCMVARQCPVCRRRVMPKPVQTGRIGRARCGPRLVAAVVTMQTVARLPRHMIQGRLKREYHLHVSR